MSTKAIHELLALNPCLCTDRTCIVCRTSTEVETIERAAKDLTRLHIGDFTDNVAHRDNVLSDMLTDASSQWSHPDVKAWSDASALLESIAKGAK